VKDAAQSVDTIGSMKMVELRIYKNDFKSTNPQIEVLDLLFYKATKIIIDSVSHKYSKISKEMVKPR
jgi:hypothetical protein